MTPPQNATAVVPVASPDGHWRIPGLPNLHSHAFQRAMAGLAERQTHPEDSMQKDPPECARCKPAWC